MRSGMTMVALAIEADPDEPAVGSEPPGGATGRC